MIKITGMILLAVLSVSLHAAKPNLVLLPIDVSQTDVELEGQYGSALQQGLQKRYTVFYGAAVEKELEKEYQKINCDAETCNQNVAIAFNGELIADSEVKKISGGYLLKLVIRNVLTSEVIETNTIPCENCSQFDVIRQLKSMGGGAESNGKTKISGGSSSVATANSGQRAILIFDSQPTGAEISINGKAVGNTPYQGLDHKIGDKVDVTLSQEYYRPYDLTLDLQQAITQLEPFVLEQGQGQVLIASKPFKANAVVYVNGQAKGTAPLTLSLPAGEHSVQIKADGESTASQKIKVKDGSDTQQVLGFSVKAASGQVSEVSAHVSKVSAQGLNIKMVSIPAGSFQMGCVSGKDCKSKEKPVHSVSIKAFKMSETEVTFANWDACFNVGGCSHKPKDEGWGRGNRPVMNVSHNDITQQFIPWLNKATGKQFSLPSEAQWEYAARAGSTTKYNWGHNISCSQARYGYYLGKCGDQMSTDPVKNFAANKFGLYDMHGNVWEWTQDCWNDSYNGAPSNGKAWQGGNCRKRVLRGGSWYDSPGSLRSADRGYGSATDRGSGSGFRLVQGR
jgi:formylglycine-generating enzyme required for sulfatase activity